MQQVTIQDASTQLPSLVAAAMRGELVLITTDDDQTIRLLPVPNTKPKQQRRSGTAKGMIHMADDFDAPLEDFQDYM